MNATHAYLVIGLAALAMILTAGLAALGTDIPASLDASLTALVGGLVAGGVIVGADGVRRSADDKKTDADNEAWKNDP